MKSALTQAMKKILSRIPPAAIKFTYLKICKPRPLRVLADSVIKLMIPESLALAEGRVFLDKNDVEVCGALALGAHDPFEIEVFRKTLRPGMNVVDIGANIGYYTVIAAGRVGKTGRVFAYEPEEKNFALIQKNIEENHFNWATAIKEAVSDHAGRQTLFLADKHTGVHSFINNRDFTRKTEVVSDTLDHSLIRFGSPKIDVIKMDIEGFEIMALDGMRQTISRNPDLVMFLELYPQAIERLNKRPLNYLNMIKDLGFSLSIVDEDRREVRMLAPDDFQSFLDSIPKTGEVVKNIMATKN